MSLEVEESEEEEKVFADALGRTVSMTVEGALSAIDDEVEVLLDIEVEVESLLWIVVLLKVDELEVDGEAEAVVLDASVLDVRVSTVLLLDALDAVEGMTV